MPRVQVLRSSMVYGLLKGSSRYKLFLHHYSIFDIFTTSEQINKVDNDFGILSCKHETITIP